jgi:hypothetical protein
MSFQNEKEKIFHSFWWGSEQSDFPTRVLYRLTSYTLKKKKLFAKKVKNIFRTV